MSNAQDAAARRAKRANTLEAAKTAMVNMLTVGQMMSVASNIIAGKKDAAKGLLEDFDADSFANVYQLAEDTLALIVVEKNERDTLADPDAELENAVQSTKTLSGGKTKPKKTAKRPHLRTVPKAK